MEDGHAGAVLAFRFAHNRMNLNKKLFVFDLDGTLAESKSSLILRWRACSANCSFHESCPSSLGCVEQFETQLLANLLSDDHFENLFLLPRAARSSTLRGQMVRSIPKTSR